MLRRFEIYSLDPEAPRDSVAAFTRAARDCARFIPEVLHSAIGINGSSTPLHLVWEHGYASPADYVRYMEHPFHAARLDRFLMADNPEQITADNDYGVGLAGYACDGPVYFIADGARRVVMLRLAEGAEAEFSSIAAQASGRHGMILSTFHENSFAARWLDGETVITAEPRYGHIWEQGFASLNSALDYPSRWVERAEGMVIETIDLVYTIEPGFGYHRP